MTFTAAPALSAGRTPPVAATRRAFGPAAAGLTLALGLLVSGCGVGGAGAEMRTVNGDKFTVSLPGEAERTERAVPTVTGDPLTTVIYSVRDGDRAYAVSYVDYPAGVDIDLQGAVDGVANGVRGRVTASEALTVDGHPARAGVVNGAKDSSSKAEGTSFVTQIDAGNRMYSVMAVVQGGDDSLRIR
jgi:hypothetical protein